LQIAPCFIPFDTYWQCSLVTWNLDPRYKQLIVLVFLLRCGIDECCLKQLSVLYLVDAQELFRCTNDSIWGTTMYWVLPLGDPSPMSRQLLCSEQFCRKIQNDLILEL
jgi:hypothetical protein